MYGSEFKINALLFLRVESVVDCVEGGVEVFSLTEKCVKFFFFKTALH